MGPGDLSLGSGSLRPASRARSEVFSHNPSLESEREYVPVPINPILIFFISILKES